MKRLPKMIFLLLLLAWLLSELVRKKFRCSKITLTSRNAIKQEKLAAKKNIVELMLFGLERGDGTVRGEERVD